MKSRKDLQALTASVSTGLGKKVRCAFVQRLYFVIIALVLCAGAWGQDATDVTFITNNTSDGSWYQKAVGDDVTISDVTVTLNAKKFNSGGYLQMSESDSPSNPSIKISSGLTINKVSVYFTRENGFGISSADPAGTISSNTWSSAQTPAVWEGEATSLTLNFSTNARITKLVVSVQSSSSSLPKPILTLSDYESSINVNTSGTQTPAVTVGDTDSNGNTISDEDKTTIRNSITWSSGDESVITVESETGKLGTALKKGTATITAKSAATDSYDAATASYTVTVTDPTARSDYDEDRPVGFGENVTGAGGSGTTTYIGGDIYVVDTHDKLIEALQGTESVTVYVSGTIYFNGADTLRGVKNKTIIGLPGAKLQNAIKRYGTLESNSDYDGGKYKKHLDSETDKDAVWSWIKTAMDVDKTGILCLYNCDNIVMRNLAFEGEGDFDIDGKDDLTLHGSTNIWIDHCSFQDGIDGNFDCIHGSDNIAVTWCKFFYTKASKTDDGVTGDASSGHKDSNLWGHSDDNTDEDEGRLNTTFANCYWGDNIKDRMPRVRFGKVHIYNCLYDVSLDKSISTNFSRCITAGYKASVTAENCVFNNKAADEPYNTSIGTDASLQLLNWLKGTNTTAQTDVQKKNGEGTYFTPSYSTAVNKYDVTFTESEVRNYAGTTLSYTEPEDNDNPTEISVSMTKEYTSFCSAYPLDFTNVAGLKAYVATGLTMDDSKTDIKLAAVTLKRVSKAAGGTGLILKSDNTDGGMFSVPISTDELEEVATKATGDDVGSVMMKKSVILLSDGTTVAMLSDGTVLSDTQNYMKGVVAQKAIGMNCEYYIDESSAFHRRYSNDFVLKDGRFQPSYWGYIKGGKAYLTAPEGTIVAYQYPAASSGVMMMFDDEVTGIAELDAAQRAADDAWYTLSGVRVQRPQQGIYIHNGKKVVVW